MTYGRFFIVPLALAFWVDSIALHELLFKAANEETSA